MHVWGDVGACVAQVSMRIVKTGNNLPTLFVLERVESDPQVGAPD
jgi:hypothetical protein